MRVWREFKKWCSYIIISRYNALKKNKTCHINSVSPYSVTTKVSEGLRIKKLVNTSVVCKLMYILWKLVCNFSRNWKQIYNMSWLYYPYIYSQRTLSQHTTEILVQPCLRLHYSQQIGNENSLDVPHQMNNFFKCGSYIQGNFI